MNKLEIIKKQWNEYETEFAKSDYIDIDTHTSMAFKVPMLLNKLDKIHKDLLQMKKIGNCTYVDIDYMLNAIENDKY
ncbi:hypothetical protein [Lysinibacillus sp. BPa_S21]|uniref:hypothetical protein n=1 Tax=Lysinibacillus sp. BPa_S21 TaxID=2932478 RepID=UPI002011EFF4|nr:hypothetical protein [Lysinibacillus sp. BPa_S21]MCL1696381.1 hypothetical protein [Lysinibacillus sp. BPa_S21]